MTTPAPPPESNPWAPPAEGGHRTPPGTPHTDPYPHPMGPPPGAPQGSYGYPLPHQGDYGLPFAPPPPAPSNGMGITALTLGMVSTVLGMLVFLFWATWLPGVLALVFGIVGLRQVKRGRATNKGVAVSGVILGIAGLLLSGAGGYFAVTKYREIENRVTERQAADDARPYGRPTEGGEGRGADAAPPLPTPEPSPEPKIMPLGKTFTYADGIKITVSAPKAFAPSRYARHLLKPGNRAYYLKITIVNGSQERLSPLSYPQITDEEGTEVETMFDTDYVSHFARTVLPGKQSSSLHAFQVPRNAPTELQLEYAPDYSEHTAQIWTGTVK
ncbi:DUF4190 domain-containing protein [Streptomyces sp. NPDC058657]|uniref:DUF4190 domain-containing protein n=1 Tax=unclassified Streptomyces TaxID=2593676 RepID=UPI00365870BA